MSAKIYKTDNTLRAGKTFTFAKTANVTIKSLDEWENILSEIDKPLRETLLPKYEHYIALSEENSIANLWADDGFKKAESPCLIDALNILAPHERSIIHQMYWDGKSIREISKNLSIARSTIVRIRNKALKTLKEHLGDEVLINGEAVPN